MDMSMTLITSALSEPAKRNKGDAVLVVYFMKGGISAYVLTARWSTSVVKVSECM